MKLYPTILALSFILLCSCSQNIARFSIVSTGATAVPNTVQKGQYVSGSDCIRRILFISFGNETNRISGAVANALERAAKKGLPADALINVDISSTYKNFIVYGSNCIVAKGQPIGL